MSGVQVWLYDFLILALDEDEWAVSHHVPRERAPDIELIWKGPRTNLDTG
jgi:hypothetical protein